MFGPFTVVEIGQSYNSLQEAVDAIGALIADRFGEGK